MTAFSWLLAFASPVTGATEFDVAALVVLAGTMAVLATVLLLHRFASRPRATAALGRRVGMRARAKGVAVVPQRDPDAAGHCRPRAPGHAPTVAPGIAAAA